MKLLLPTLALFVSCINPAPQPNNDPPNIILILADDQTWTVDHFYSKLLKLNQGFNTSAAKQEAQKRHDYMLNFLTQLESEICL